MTVQFGDSSYLFRGRAGMGAQEAIRSAFPKQDAQSPVPTIEPFGESEDVLVKFTGTNRAQDFAICVSF